jgi:hypothetical protein
MFGSTSSQRIGGWISSMSTSLSVCIEVVEFIKPIPQCVSGWWETLYPLSLFTFSVLMPQILIMQNMIDIVVLSVGSTS